MFFEILILNEKSFFFGIWIPEFLDHIFQVNSKYKKTNQEINEMFILVITFAYHFLYIEIK